MTNYKNDLPPYAEEIKIEQPTAQQVIQEILNKFKQPVPDKFVKLKVEEGNYQFSTNPKWKEKVPCERYGFSYLEDNQEKWIQIDIPHTLLENLEIAKGEDITHPLYLSPKVAKKKDIRGAKTIEKEEEIFIDKPVSENGAERQLIKSLTELEELREKVKELKEGNEEENKKITDLEERLKKWEKTFFGENASQVQNRIDGLNSQVNSLQVQLNTANSELAKEKGWWDKWINNGKTFIEAYESEDYPGRVSLTDYYRIAISYNGFTPLQGNIASHHTVIFHTEEFNVVKSFKKSIERDRIIKQEIKDACYGYYRDR